MRIHAYSLNYQHHVCRDETAAVANDRWICQCPGGPYWTSTDAVRRARLDREQERAYAEFRKTQTNNERVECQRNRRAV